MIKIEDKIINIYCNDIKSNSVPLIILNTYDENGMEIFNETKKLTNKEFILATVSNIDWNNEMSPWYMEKLYKNESDYLGNADTYLKLLTDKILIQIKNIIKTKLNIDISYTVLAGYSLAGLFALYSIYKTNAFDRIVCCSGSLWYPNFIDYVKSNIPSNKVTKIYFSLGNSESHTKNTLMSKVEENTKFIEKYLNNFNIKTIYEENEGNHFMNVSNRIAKGIKWIL